MGRGKCLIVYLRNDPECMYVWNSMIVICVLSCCVVSAVVAVVIAVVFSVVIVVDIPSTLSSVVHGLCFIR